ncbi:secretion activator protein [Vibrio alginolyticus]|uniref:glycosyl hydrolase 108 family protein n=2 Tax=Vibrio alginolyticus TaxID=663 RepID=UPI001D6BE1A5|nr:glycosyl hydrolase 108 family protein [Vibrio alginolyticus]EGR1298367.1 secretion activator protein [Vibrio alginolyticus]MCS0279958.1 secretion activator protein [Vibrio alginolyticus]
MGFDKLFDRIMGHEGGLSLNPKDRGNWTSGIVGVGELKGSKYGVSAMSYPDLDIVNLTRTECKEIVYRDFYKALGIHHFCDAMQFQMMDAAYHHGIYNATKIFQRTVKTKDDGIAGRNTMKAAKAMSENDKLLRFGAYRLFFMAKIDSFDEFGRGWTNRVANNLLYAAEDNTDPVLTQ